MEHGDASCVFGVDRPAQATTDRDADDPPSDEITMDYRQPDAASLS